MRSPKPNAALRQRTGTIEEARLSGPDKPPPREKLGRSPLLPKRGGRGF
jgi:hypothetical protein